jgi:hypothetical protein
MTLCDLEKAATPGPWRADYWYASEPRRHIVSTPNDSPVVCQEVTDADAALIAAMRTVLPKYLRLEDAARAFAAAPRGSSDEDDAISELLNAVLALDKEGK